MAMLNYEVEMLERYLQGQECEAYRLFGAHFVERDGVKGVFFRLYAPFAKEVFVIGSFNGYRHDNRMEKADYRGVYECFIPYLDEYTTYLYDVHRADDSWARKADPFAFFADCPPLYESRVFDINGFIWHDEDFMKRQTRNYDRPMSIYEMHLASWRKGMFGEILSYEQIADQLIPYLKKMHFTHVEFMPLTQHPFLPSWGYQATGFYAIDARYGNPKQLMSLVDRLHQAGIGVIIDFAPAHFATDEYGLSYFDGSHLYEYEHDGMSEWGSYLFDLGRDPVRSFLISAIDMFASMYHFDGVRIDAVANIIYYHGNCNRGTNDGGVEFLKRMNSYMHSRHPSFMTIAEDSTAYQGVTHWDGLGFDYKWDLGWMNDTLKYYSRDPIYKKYHHNEITFSMAYFRSERFLLPLSHDEVVHLKHSLVNKMPGSYDDKFALLKNLYAYQMCHPGKRLLFMGSEFAPFEEWDESKSLEWNYLTFPKHDSVRAFLSDLNAIEKDISAFHSKDYEEDGFEWTMVDNSNDSIFAFLRKSRKSTYLCIFNMTPVERYDYKIGCPPGKYKLILDSSEEQYGGHTPFNHYEVLTSPGAPEGRSDGISIGIAPFAALIFRLER